MANAKVARREKASQKKVYGQKVYVINLTGKDNFCASTGRKLPKRGMVVVYNDKYYIDWKASEIHGLASS